MPTVDFTLEDIARQSEQIIVSALVKERENTANMLANALVKERGHTQVMIQETVSAEFMSFWDDNLSPVLEEILTDVKDLKRDAKGLHRLVNQHSKDIMELRAAQ